MSSVELIDRLPSTEKRLEDIVAILQCNIYVYSSRKCQHRRDNTMKTDRQA